VLIRLTSGQHAIVDAEDYARLSQWKWYSKKHRTGSFYAYRNIGSKPKRNMVMMHRLIVGAEAGQEVDHANGDTLDNRRENLRICTGLENRRNKKRYKTNTSGYKGVWKQSDCNRWRAYIGIRGKTRYIGLYATAEEAAGAYDAAALEEFGDFARLNFPHSVVFPGEPGAPARP
jgi:HNH endonuclease/AP2 domain